MENHFPFRKIDNLQNMMINILDQGQDEVFKSFESIKEPLNRARKRKIYNQAMIKIMKGK